MRAITHFLFSLASLFFLVLCQSGYATTVDSFSPQGIVKGVRQVRVHFSDQMVPFGDLHLSDPFSVSCAEPGVGRWVDGKNWSYDFARDIPAGVNCRFELKAGLQDIAGNPVTAEQPYTFSTGGPAVKESLPGQGMWAIDENQIFILGLDTPADTASIEKNVYCTASGINEQIGVRLIEGKQRDTLLSLNKNVIDAYLTVYFKARGSIWKWNLALKNNRIDQLPIVMLQCKQTLPAESTVHLVWGAGVVSASGIATQKDQVLAFKTRPAFAARFSCTRTSAKGKCIPFLAMNLNFTAPISSKSARAIRLIDGSGKQVKAEIDHDDIKNEFVSSISFKGPFVENSAYLITLPAKLTDDAGRRLKNAQMFPLKVATDMRPPLIKFPSRFGILEADGDRLLPVTVRNVEPSLVGNMAAVQGSMVRVHGDAEQDLAIIDWLKRLGGNGSWRIGETWTEQIKQSIFNAGESTQSFRLPKPNGKQAFEVIGIPLKANGFYVVELQSPKLGKAITEKGGTAYIQSAALVTNLAAHFKHGAASSLVWVTSLDKAQPVPDAQVVVRSCDGKALWQGSTDKDGVAHINQTLPGLSCSFNDNYFISARSHGDMTFTLSDWVGGIETWRFNVPTQDFQTPNLIVTTVFDRTLFRVGETVHMKHFMREHTLEGIRYVNDANLHDKARANFRRGINTLQVAVNNNGSATASNLVITHQGTGQQFEVPLSWSAHGTAEDNWQIPANAKQGTYDLTIDNFPAGSFRVEAFRVPTMKAILQGPTTPVIQAGSVDLDLQLNYLAGGTASDAPVKLRTVLQDKVISFPDYGDINFSNGNVKEGLQKDAADVDDDAVDYDQAGDTTDVTDKSTLATRTLNLDHNGAARVSIDKLPQLQQPKQLLAEMEYADANGETSTISTHIPLWTSNYLIGVKPDAWTTSKDDFKFQVVVLDISGKPAADASVAVDFFERKTYSHRHRLIGGFYAFENSSEINKVGAACSGKTDAKGMLFCEVKAPISGNVILRASTQDRQGRAAYANAEAWVAGSDQWWFAATDNDRIDVLAENKRVEAGQDASFQVRMPFREATALVTVEREGIADTYIRQLSGKNPTFSIPVKASYAPNVYVSVFVVRGRVDSIQPTALVDLGKPAYKMGIARLQVGWQPHELKVQVTTDKPVYKTREVSHVQVHVTRADGKPLPSGAEIALAAVDTGLLELMPNTSWDLLDAMMQERSLQVTTSTAQMQVIGKRHFGRKAVPHGGGGGKSAGRELFDTLLFWKARVVLDANGNANMDVPLNDSLTEFRIVAIANANADLFGTGKTDIRSTQDLILLSGLPGLVREGDKYRAGFTVRNTSSAATTVTVNGTVTESGASAQATAHTIELADQTVSIKPGEARDVGWIVTVPVGAPGLVWNVAAKSGDNALSDKIRIKQNVTYAVPVKVYQATLMQIDKPLNMRVQIPADALPGRGGIQTLFSPRLGNELPGVQQYMKNYHYTCFEQDASKAVALQDQARWNTHMDSLPAYLDSDGLVKYFPMMLSGSDTLTAYILSLADEAGYVVPAGSKERMENALIGFVQGRIVRNSQLPTADVAIRKMAALEALSRSGKVRPELLQSFSIEPNLWPTSAVLDWYMVLKRTKTLPQRDEKMRQVEQILRSRLNFQGTTMGFSTERTDDLWWLMISTDVNANRLLLAVLDNERWFDDIGRLVRGTLGRQHQGRWNTTVANAWGVLAIKKYSAQFESTPVTGSASVTLNNKSSTLDWTKNPAGSTFMQAWPKQAENLSIVQTGAGKPWVTVQSLAAIPLTQPISTGYKVVKTITPVEQKTPGVWSRGDVYRVHLDMEAQSDMTWVVVDDPIPASASILGNGLGRDSQILSAGEKHQGWVWPAFEERTFEAFRAYYDFVPKGKWVVEYSVRLNNSGDFVLPQTRIEAMYAPEMFAEIPNQVVHVAP